MEKITQKQVGKILIADQFDKVNDFIGLTTPVDVAVSNINTHRSTLRSRIRDLDKREKELEKIQEKLKKEVR